MVKVVIYYQIMIHHYISYEYGCLRDSNSPAGDVVPRVLTRLLFPVTLAPLITPAPIANNPDFALYSLWLSHICAQSCFDPVDIYECFWITLFGSWLGLRTLATSLTPTCLYTPERYLPVLGLIYRLTLCFH